MSTVALKRFITKFYTQDVCAALLLLSILLIVFWPEANKEFLFWDDEAVLSQYKPFLPVTWSTILEISTSTFTGLFKPVTKAVWILIILPMQWFSGSRWSTENWVQPFILASVFFHFLNCLLIKEIITILFKKNSDEKSWKDWIPVFLYALHPLHAEALASAPMLKESLWVFFGLLSLRAYLKNHLKRSLVLFFLAVFSKPVAVIIAGLILLLQIIRGGPRSFTKRISIYFAALFCLALFTGILAKKIQPTEDFTTSLLERFLYLADTFGFYLTKILLPLNLTADYGRTYIWLRQQGWTIEMTAFLIFISSLLVLFWRRKESRTHLIFLTAILFLPLLPVSGIIPFAMQHYGNVADHYATFSLIAWSGFLYLFIKKYNRLYFLFILLGIFYGWQSFQQKGTWINNETLSMQVLKINPRSFMAYNNMGLHWLRLGKEQPALEAFAKSIELNPNLQDPYLNSFYILNKRGLHDESATLLEEGKKNSPKSSAIRFRLGQTYWRQNQFESAISELREANRLQPDNQIYSDTLKKSEILFEEIKKTN